MDGGLGCFTSPVGHISPDCQSAIVFCSGISDFEQVVVVLQTGSRNPLASIPGKDFPLPLAYSLLSFEPGNKTCH